MILLYRTDLIPPHHHDSSTGQRIPNLPKALFFSLVRWLVACYCRYYSSRSRFTEDYLKK
jgi:hypothetical protein